MEDTTSIHKGKDPHSDGEKSKTHLGVTYHPRIAFEHREDRSTKPKVVGPNMAEIHIRRNPYEKKFGEPDPDGTSDTAKPTEMVKKAGSHVTARLGFHTRVERDPGGSLVRSPKDRNTCACRTHKLHSDVALNHHYESPLCSPLSRYENGGNTTVT